MERMKFMMMMDWEKIRDNRGFYYYEGYDGNKKVVDIFPNDHYNKKWRVRILDRAPWHSPNLKLAKSNKKSYKVIDSNFNIKINEDLILNQLKKLIN